MYPNTSFMFVVALIELETRSIRIRKHNNLKRKSEF